MDPGLKRLRAGFESRNLVLGIGARRPGARCGRSSAAGSLILAWEWMLAAL